MEVDDVAARVAHPRLRGTMLIFGGGDPPWTPMLGCLSTHAEQQYIRERTEVSRLVARSRRFSSVPVVTTAPLIGSSGSDWESVSR